MRTSRGRTKEARRSRCRPSPARPRRARTRAAGRRRGAGSLAGRDPRRRRELRDAQRKHAAADESGAFGSGATTTMKSPEYLVIITGLSGSGKSYVQPPLEALGFSGSDTLPIALIEPF